MYNLEYAAKTLSEPHTFMDEQVATLPCVHYRMVNVHPGYGLRQCAGCGMVYTPNYFPFGQQVAACAVGDTLQ